MASRSFPIVALGDMIHGQEADTFVLMTTKEELITRDGKKYFRVGFRDARREVTFPVWGDAPLAEDCRRAWTPGAFYKVRAVYRDTTYGPQLEIARIRETVPADEADGFSPAMCLAQSRFDPATMFADLVALAETRIADANLARLVLKLLNDNRAALLVLPAATRNHHAFAGGWLEHVLSVARTAAFLADKYDEHYPDLTPRLNKDLVVAGAMLHDIGKLEELETSPTGAQYSPAGSLLGHVIQGRDMVRAAADEIALDADVRLRLEHIIVSHQRLPEWGSPKPPMTPEALLVHYSDDVDAKFFMMFAALRDDAGEGPITSKKNALMQHVYRGTAPTKNGA